MISTTNSFSQFERLNPRAGHPLATGPHPSERTGTIRRPRQVYDCSLTAASLVVTDLSQSQFTGPSGANLSGLARLIETSFRYTQISEAVFKRAVIARADFLGAILAPQIRHHLRARDAVHVS
jgi:uncharacterized protein YjbI with pentapeptide repeats